jgi:hypothetical protein
MGDGGQLRIETDANVTHVVRDIDLHNLRTVFGLISPVIQEVRRNT